MLFALICLVLRHVARLIAGSSKRRVERLELRREDRLSEIEKATRLALTTCLNLPSTITRSTLFRFSSQTTSMASDQNQRRSMGTA